MERRAQAEIAGRGVAGREGRVRNLGKKKMPLGHARGPFSRGGGGGRQHGKALQLEGAAPVWVGW